MTICKDTTVENPKGLALLVPGIAYPCQMPQLYFAKEVALANGYNVREMAWEPGMEWTAERVVAEVAAALEGNELPVLIMAKSIGSLSSVYAAKHGLPGVWITPVLEKPEAVEAIGATKQPQLAIGGSVDPHWNSEAAKAWPQNVKVQEFEGADHSTLVAGDVVRGAEIVAEYTREMDAFVKAL